MTTSNSHLLQIANVGRITGGTAACAWTVARSLPAFRHTVAFLGPISRDTRRAFADCRLLEWDRVAAPRVAALKPDVVLLHNTSPARCDGRLPTPTLLYRHSASRPAAADLTLYCSRWLAEQCGGGPEQILLQAVPRPLRPDTPGDTRSLREDLVIGRICTPIARKWPPEIIDFYRDLACALLHSNKGANTKIRYEFIGAPANLQTSLQTACNGRATFHSAAWEARTRLWQWDVLLYHNPAVTESFGRTAAEAMRAGCIPVVDDRGGFREQIAAGCGYLCREPADFHQAIAELQSPARRWKMSQACRAHADEHFSLARFGNDLLRRFQQAQRRRRNNPGERGA